MDSNNSTAVRTLAYRIHLSPKEDNSMAAKALASKILPKANTADSRMVMANKIPASRIPANRIPANRTPANKIPASKILASRTLLSHSTGVNKTRLTAKPTQASSKLLRNTQIPSRVITSR